ncbi:hypothetical protein [Marinicrinis lubricantis]|uniref:Uncharacterized protein n=1 Tax=Marinicrinis lubricantis TaxID=2086470 RepID=A0ABW1IN39_9BACL
MNMNKNRSAKGSSRHANRQSISEEVLENYKKHASQNSLNHEADTLSNK